MHGDVTQGGMNTERKQKRPEEVAELDISCVIAVGIVGGALLGCND